MTEKNSSVAKTRNHRKILLLLSNFSCVDDKIRKSNMCITKVYTRHVSFFLSMGVDEKFKSNATKDINSYTMRSLCVFSSLMALGQADTASTFSTAAAFTAVLIFLSFYIYYHPTRSTRKFLILYRL